MLRLLLLTITIGNTSYASMCKYLQPQSNNSANCPALTEICLNGRNATMSLSQSDNKIYNMFKLSECSHNNSKQNYCKYLAENKDEVYIFPNESEDYNLPDLLQLIISNRDADICDYLLVNSSR